MRSHFLMQSVVLSGLLLLLGAGCRSGDSQRYIPPEPTAREALDAALTAWQNGRPVGLVAEGPPTIQAVDSRWRAGQKLLRYEVVGEEPGNGPTFFSVRLKVKGKAQEQMVRYVVVGRDPLWVYREDDFQTSSGM